MATVNGYTVEHVDYAIYAGAFTTALRPAANTKAAGCRYYDITLHKPGFSDGTIWRDSNGTAM